MHSLFEEQIAREQMSRVRALDGHGESFAEAGSYLPEPARVRARAATSISSTCAGSQHAVHVPVIASLNGTTAGGWIDYARLIAEAGAHALELNCTRSSTDPALTRADHRARGRRHRAARSGERSTIPVAVKLSPFYTAFAHFAHALDALGADGLVLFNRFYQPDIDVEQLDGDARAAAVRLVGAAAAAALARDSVRRVKASLAVTGGVHSALDVVKAIMAGAHAMQMVSALLQARASARARCSRRPRALDEEHEWDSLDAMRGNMNFATGARPGRVRARELHADAAELARRGPGLAGSP